MDGNAEQVRAIAMVLAEQIEARLSERLSLDSIDERIDAKIAASEERQWGKVQKLALAQSVPVIIGAFFLGGIWVQLKDVPATLEGRGQWMGTVEERVGALERWARGQGYQKPEPKELPR